MTEIERCECCGNVLSPNRASLLSKRCGIYNTCETEILRLRKKKKEMKKND